MVDDNTVQSHAVRLRSSADTEGEVQRVLSKLEASGRDLDIVAVMANWRSGFRPFVMMADALLHRGALAPELREIAVLHIAKSMELEYEWREHLPMARRAGVTDPQVHAIEDGSWRDQASAEFTMAGLLVLQCVDQLATTRALNSGLWEQLCASLGQDAALEVMMGFAWWGGFVRIVIEGLMPLVDRA